jgi:quinol monooxygenase YgiN
VLTLISKITAKQDKVLELKQALENLIPLSSKEKGCRTYHFYQSNEGKNVFFFFEVWESQDHLDQHLASTHIADFITISAGLLASPIEMYPLTKIK